MKYNHKQQNFIFVSIHSITLFVKVPFIFVLGIKNSHNDLDREIKRMKLKTLGLRLCQNPNPVFMAILE